MYLGIDYGKKRIGLAVGSRYPRGIGTLQNPGSFDSIIKKIVGICRDYEVEEIVIGLPTRPGGEKGELASEIEIFGIALGKQAGLPVYYEEEAYTSVEAEGELISRGIDLRKEKEKIDELSAILILEQYIESKISEEEK